MRLAQKELVTHLLDLIRENPDLEIMPMVDSEVVCSDDFGWWVGGWGMAEIDEYHIDDERIYLKSKDLEELVDDLMNYNEDMTEEEAEKIAEGREWKKAIFVRIITP